MQNRKLVCLALLLALSFFCLSCQEEQPKNVSVDGAVVITGLEIDSDLNITNPQTTFKTNEDFYFYFHNNQPFNDNLLTVQLIEARTEKVLAEHTYEVDPEEHSLTDGIYFGSAGQFLVAVRLGGQVKAAQEVVIE